MSSTKIGFTGDFSFSAYFRGCEKDKNLLDNNILEFLNGNDANIINFESPITDCRMTKKKRLAHRSEPQVLNYVKDNIKNPILSLANNHMMDYDRIGMIDTVDNVSSAHIPFIGAGKNVDEAVKYTIVGDDIKVGIFAVQYKKYKIAGKRYSGPLHDVRIKLIKENIEELKKKVDYIVLVYHGGDEFLHTPMPYFRKHLKKYLGLGVDLIVAHHPHVVQGYEFFGEKAIFYSLGNFMFDTDYQRAQDDSDKGILLNICFSKEGFTFDSLSIKIDREKHQVRSSDPDEYFKNMRDINYSKLWAKEALRKQEVLEKARILKEKEVTEREEQERVKLENIENLKKKHKLYLVENVEEDESYLEEEELEINDNSSGESLEAIAEIKQKKVSIYKRLKKLKKRIISKKNYEKLVIKYGALKAKLFYR